MWHRILQYLERIRAIIAYEGDPWVCRDCDGTGRAMNQECQLEQCIWCKGTGIKRP